MSKIKVCLLQKLTPRIPAVLIEIITREFVGIEILCQECKQLICYQWHHTDTQPKAPKFATLQNCAASPKYYVCASCFVPMSEAYWQARAHRRYVQC